VGDARAVRSLLAERLKDFFVALRDKLPPA